MNKEELIKATRILQKHIPNRYPLQNAYVEAMNEYAKWYHEEKSKLSQHDVIGSKPTATEKNNLPEDVRYAFNEGVDLYQCINNYEMGNLIKEVFIEDIRKIKKRYK